MTNPNQGDQALMRDPVKGKPVDPPTPWERSKGKIYALILIALLLGISALSTAAYNKAFDGTVPVTLKADRAGLQMQAGNRVKVRGVDLGRVDDVQLSEDQTGVDITLALDPDLLAQIPDNVTVSLEQLSAFGNKAVQMNIPAQPSGRFLAEGAVIDADHISVEVNSTFDSLMTLLNRVQPAKLNAVLGGLANTFEGNGETLGVALTQTNAYLKKFNNDLPALQRDFRSAGGFADVYADAGNDIADLLRNAGTIADTLGDKKDDFNTTLVAVEGVTEEVTDFFGENGDPLVKMLRSLRPFTSLLDEYAPVITCFIDGSAVTWDHLSKGFNESGATFEVNVVEPGSSQLYKYPQDLPEIGPGPEKGPNCRGLPKVNNNEDSLADYISGPESLRQRYTNNSPRPALQGEGVPGPGAIGSIFPPAFPLANKAPLSAKGLKANSAVPPLVQFFAPGPQPVKIKKAGK